MVHRNIYETICTQSTLNGYFDFLSHLVLLRLPELLRALADPDLRALHVGLDRVHELALLVHHRRQVLEDGVHVDDVGLEMEGEGIICFDSLRIQLHREGMLHETV